jgi:4-aminobutyrate aminotransferase / (S)-3-amino-2-methylpropionate transaminase / 5-aminovalerate transaminase
MINAPAFLKRAIEVGNRMRGHLEKIAAENPIVGDVRGLGPMLAMELVRNKETREPLTAAETMQVNAETLKRGLITIRAGLYSNCVRFLPPLNISDDEIDEGMEVVAEAMRIVNKNILATV